MLASCYSVRVIRAILRALAAVVRRDLTAHALLRTNNFFLFVALLIWGALVSGVEPASSYPFLALLALLLFFPIASDPLEKIPPVRLGLWPLSRKVRFTLRLASLALNPIVWITGGLLLRQGLGYAWSAGAVLAAAWVRAQAPHHARGLSAARMVPELPGTIGILARAHLRRMLATLDVWLALVIATIGTAWRIFGRAPDPAAWPILSILIGIALSTWAQSGYGLDGTRFRLVPLSARRIVLAGDAAYLSVQLMLTAPLDPIAGLAFGMTALAIGRYPALDARAQPRRWRFTGGRVFYGAAQIIGGSMLAFAGVRGAAIAVLLWAASATWASSVLAQRLGGVEPHRAPGRQRGGDDRSKQ
jgi:hypothetical protein